MRLLLRIGVAAMTAVVLMLGAVALIPAERVAELAARELQARTGRAITIAGPVRPSIWPVLGVETGPVTIANAEWSQEGPFLSAEGLDLGLDLGALLGGELVIRRLVLTAPALVLERSAEGAANWDFAAAGEGSADGLSAAIDRAELRDGRILHIDHRRGTRTAVEGLDATAAMPQADGPLTVTLSGVLNGQPATLSLVAADGAGALAGRIVPLTAEGTAGAARMAFDGRAGGTPLAAEGALSADLGDPRALAALVGAGSVALPEGLGARDIVLEGRVTLAPEGSVHLRGAALTLDGNRLTGDADLTFAGARPKLVARLSATALSVPGLGPGGAGAAPAGDAWSAAPLGVRGLDALDAEVALSAESLALGGLTAAPVALRTVLDRARAVTEIGRMGLFGGTLAGQFVVNDRSGLSVGGDLTFSGLDMQAALTALAGYGRLSGKGSGRLEFLGAGSSLAAIMASLRGEGSLEVAGGDLSGLDLAAILRALDPSVPGDGSTDFDRVTASFTIDGGVLTNRDLRLEGPGIAAEGRGTVGLGARTIDYALTATALAGADGSGGIGVPLRIAGPWSAPRLTLDLRALAERELAAEKAELEAKAKAAAEKAKAELEERLEAETGIDPEAGETLEDAARRRAQDLLEQEAARILEGLSGQGE